MKQNAANSSTQWAIIGMGPSGLTTLKNFRDAGIPALGFEQRDEVGGNWYFDAPNSSIYASTHLISSKRMTEFTDYPLPKQLPPFPSHPQVWQYLKDYARDFNLYPQIEFNQTVERLEPISANASSGWKVYLAGEADPRRYDGVVIANGHHWDPRWPEIPGQFAGQIIHAHDYREPKIFEGKRVLVVGAGNSGCDIAVEAAVNAKHAAISMRRGYHFLPKFLAGRPIDSMGHRLRRLPIPQWLRRMIAQWSIAFALGKPQRYGLPKPDKPLFYDHPIINSHVTYYVGHGELGVHADVRSLAGNTVHFVDDTSAEFDLIVYATGYRLSFPFIDVAHLNAPADPKDHQPRLYLHIFHPDRDDLLVSGMIQPNSGQWGITDLQAQLMTKYIQARRTGSPRAEWFEKLKRDPKLGLPPGGTFRATERHQLEVDYYDYQRRLKRLIKKFEL